MRDIINNTNAVLDERNFNEFRLMITSLPILDMSDVLFNLQILANIVHKELNMQLIRQTGVI